MNKRIKELADEASRITCKEHPELAMGVTLKDLFGETDRKVAVIDDATAQKFAELIIQECIDVHVDNYGIDIIGDVLKEHFGIKDD